MHAKVVEEGGIGNSSVKNSLSHGEYNTKCSEALDKLGVAGWLQFMFDYAVENGYISEERLKLDKVFPCWTDNPFQVPLQVTVNCSKPELLPGQSAVRVLAKGAQCPICFENANFKPGLRAFELLLNGRDFFVQLPPYPYFKNHHIVVEKDHIEQIITEESVRDLVEYASRFRGVYIASNTDLEGTGVSIRGHRHYQAGTKRFNVFDANKWVKTGKGESKIAVLQYPALAVKIESNSMQEVCCLTNDLLKSWRECPSKLHDVINVPKDAQTMSFCVVCHENSGSFEMVLIPRNASRRTPEGLQCIKKEFVGIIEMCGLAIFPGKLASAFEEIDRLIKANNVKALESEFPQLLPFIQKYVLPSLDSCENRGFKGTGNDSCVSSSFTAAVTECFMDIVSANSAVDSSFDSLKSSGAAWLGVSFDSQE
eukprot:Nk52_evm5s2367 gene=Nk52_evmTU5s2367